MIRIFQVKCEKDGDIEKSILNKLHMKKEDLLSWTIHRKSVDARKQKVFLSYVIDAKVRHEKKYLKHFDVQPKPDERYLFTPKGDHALKNPPVVVGFGPAGMFAALLLAQYGYKPVVIDRGSSIDQRSKDVSLFWKEGILNPESNVQFGQGGAGAFSDGKLTTRSKDPLARKVLEELVKAGAKKDILIDQHPHIGTDAFVDILKNIEKEIIALGGKIYWNTCLLDVVIENDQLKKALCSNNLELDCQALILACGHSAEDTIRKLYERGMHMESKPFAVGVRIEHLQSFIDQAMLGEFAKDPDLTPARYQLTAKAKNGKGVYSFCMCPGGYVIAASSSPKQLVVNGMSYADRGGENANSALLVQVSQEDYGQGVFAGFDYQKDLEEKAYTLGQNYKAPVQLAKDYLENKPSKKIGKVIPTYKPGVTLTNLNEVFSDSVNEALKDALVQFEKKVPGFVSEDAIMSAVESRSSSAVKMERDKGTGMSNIHGIYPSGEGSGYAGGIMTSAIDGIKSAQKLMDYYTCKEIQDEHI